MSYFLNWIVGTQVLLIFMYFIAHVFGAHCRIWTYQWALKSVYFLLAMALVLPSLFGSLTSANPFGINHRPKIYLDELKVLPPMIKTKEQITSSPSMAPSVPIGTLDRVFVVALVTFLGLGLIFLYLYLVEVIKAFRLIRGSLSWRRIGSVRVQCSSAIKTPCALWLGSWYIMLPPESLLDKSNLKMILAHELAHIKNGDPLFLHLIELLKPLFCFNPFYWGLKKQVSLLQELACDEEIVEIKSLNPAAYGQCLINYAQQQIQKKSLPVSAIGMSVASDQLKRRMTAMFQQPTKKSKMIERVLFLFLILSFLGLTYMTQAFAAKRELSLSEAQAMAAKIGPELKIPLAVDERVLHWINKSIATPSSRKYLKSSLLRMENYKPMISKKLEGASLPPSLMAVPLVESGYRGDVKSYMKAAGIWQFIPSTARRCGLRVNKDLDERLKASRLTDAAVCYYNKLFAQFKDWHLAITAYNIGEGRLADVIKAQGHQDALKLAQQGHFGKEGSAYLPKVLASIFILNHPHLLN